MDDEQQVLVRYKCKGDPNQISVTVTEKQYVNLLELPIIQQCEIISDTAKPITLEEKEEFNKKINVACRQDKIHEKYLLQLYIDY